MSALRPIACLALSAAAVAGCAGPTPSPSARPGTGFELDARPDQGCVDVLFDGQLVTSYRWGDGPKPYLWPLIGPGGVELTRAWPLAERDGEERDHPHHTSVWFAHGDVNGYDFWVAGEEARIETAFVESSGDRNAAALRVGNLWMVGEQEVLLSEERVMVVQRLGDSLVIDFEFDLHSQDHDLVFGDTKEGTFALRLRPELRLRGPAAAGRILNSAGQEDGECWGRRAAWVDYSGVVDGRWVGVAVLEHPDNLRHPTWWHARDYGLVAANPFGRHDFEGAAPGSGDYRLARGEHLQFRYRVLLHPGAGEWGELDLAWRVFRAE